MNEKPGSAVLPPYSLTSAIYDHLVGDYVFEQWRDNFERLEKRYDLDISVCADVACGTGLAARYLADRGAEVYAIDRSLEMLRVAALTTGGFVRLLRQDMRYLLPPHKASVLICATDSMNHLLHEQDIQRAIRAFYSALRPEGYALFDMNTAWQLREGRDSEPWDFKIDDMPMRWISQWNEEKQVATLRFIFPSIYNERGEMLEEIHRERAYPSEWILEELERAGFCETEVLDAAGLGRVQSRTRRLQFIARRRTGS